MGEPRVDSAVDVATPEIRWHCGPTGLNEAVLSLDFLHESSTVAGSVPTILATGGADKEIKLWRVQPSVEENDGLEFVFSLSGHDRSVNCVRFSPNGQYLASASDDSTIIVWTRPKTAGDDWSWHKIESFSDISRTLLACGHKGDITDLAWSPDSLFLASASVDNCSVVWNVERGEVVERRKDHTQYVQGVAWDPLGEFLVTEGNDRTCRVYSLAGFDAVSRQQTTKKQVRKCTNMVTIKTREFPAAKIESEAVTADGSDAAADTTNDGADDGWKGAPKHRMFLDDTCPVFARRLAWTPCGSYVLAPTGVFRSTKDASAINTVYAFARGNLAKPALHLPGQEKASLGVRCSPRLYKLREQPTNFFQAPLRSIFAVITLNAVIVYDSQQPHPICTIKNLHYADLTDATWSADGCTLSISSMDGYISFIRFDEDLFGESVPRDEVRRVNEEKTQSMFTVVKATKKKVKHTSAQAQSTDDPAAASKTKKPAAATSLPKKLSPIRQAFQKRDASQLGSDASKPIDVTGSSATVNTLTVRKKLKITPTLVTMAPTGQQCAPVKESATVDLTNSTDEATT